MLAVGSSGWVRYLTAGRPETASTFRNARLVVEADARSPTRFIDAEPAISRDGTIAAYMASTETGTALFVRPMTDGRATQLVDLRVDAIIQPRWSPDGRSLLYIVPDGVFVVPAAGGTPRRVDEPLYTEWIFLARFGSFPAVAGGAAWSPDGGQIAISAGGSLALVPAEGGAPHYLVRDYPHELHSCDWAPDGRWIACIASEFARLGEFISGRAAASPQVVSTRSRTSTRRRLARSCCPHFGGDLRQLTPLVPEEAHTGMVGGWRHVVFHI